jgi:hypothetical protein
MKYTTHKTTDAATDTFVPVELDDEALDAGAVDALTEIFKSLFLPSPAEIAAARPVMQRVLERWPALTTWGLHDVEHWDCPLARAMFSVKPLVDWAREDKREHAAHRKPLLGDEGLKRFVIARQRLRVSLGQEMRLVRTVEINRKTSSSDWMGIVEREPGEIGLHGAFLAACVVEGVRVEPIRRDVVELAGDAWLDLALADPFLDHPWRRR